MDGSVGSLPRFNTLLTESDGEILSVTFNRPDIRNAVDSEFSHELFALFSAVARMDDLRIVLLRGAGGNFCAGGRLENFRDMPEWDLSQGPDPLSEWNRVLGRSMTALDNLPQAVVSVVEGAAVGGGIGLAACSDVVIAHKDAIFGMPEARVGIIPSQVVPFVTRKTGPGPARLMVATGRRVRGPEALEIGLAHFCCDTTDEVEATLEQVLTDMLACAPGSVRAAKRLILDSSHKPLEQILDEAAYVLGPQSRGGEAHSGVAAFLDKKKPYWFRKP